MKISKRFLSLLLAVIMVGNLMLSSVAATTTRASASNVIMSESFESCTNALPQNWSLHTNNGSVAVQPSTSQAQDGNVSIKLTPANQTEQNRAKLKYTMPANLYASLEDGAEYTVTAYYYSDGAKYRGNYEVKDKASPWGANDFDLIDGQWVKEEYVFTLDKSAMVEPTLQVFLGMSWHDAKNSVGDLYIDNVSIVKTKDASEVEGGETGSTDILNESFESWVSTGTSNYSVFGDTDFNATGVSKNWYIYAPNGSVLIAPSSDFVKDGKTSVKMQPKDTTQINRACITYAMTTAEYAAMEDGATYKVSVQMYSDGAKYQGRWEIKDKDSGWFNENFDLANGEWVERTYIFTLDKSVRTKPMEFVFGMAYHNPPQSAGNLYIDSVRVEKIPWVNEIVLNKNETVMGVGSTLNLTYELKPAGQQSEVIFTSSDSSVAEVDANGKITAKKAGTATITAVTAIGQATARCTVQVVDEFVALESISFNKTTLNVTPGWQEKLTVIFNPANATDKNVVWTSSNESVVKVDENGNIQALRVGTATISVRVPASGKTASCTVTVAEDSSFASTTKDITVDFGRSETVDLSKILPGNYTVLTKSFKGKAEIDGSILKYTAYTWLMEDGQGFTDAEYTDTIKVAAQDGDKSAIITLNITIGKLEELFYDEDGNWITDVDLMFSQEYLDAIKADLKSNPNGERAKIFKYMLGRVDRWVGAAIPDYYDRTFSVEVEYDTDIRPYADITVNLLMAYLLTKDLPGYEAKNEAYLQETIRYAEAGLAYPYWGATHYNKGYGWRNADLAAGHFLFSTAMVYHWLKDELKDETCTYRIGAKDDNISNPLLTKDLVTTTENMPTLEALEHRLWFVCEEMYNQTYTFDTYCGNHMHVRLGGLTAATIALRGDAETQEEKDLLVKYTGLILFKDGLGMHSLMPDGTSQEGVPYWEYAAEWLIKAGIMIRDTVDIDLFDTTHVFENSGDYVLYNLLPSDSWTASGSVLNIGDSPTNHWYGPAQILRFIAKEYNKPNAQWLADEVEAAGIEAGYSQWMNVMLFADEVEPEAPTLDHTMHWFRDLDHIIARTDWSGNEDMLSIKCGIPFGKNLMQLQKDGVYTGRADAGHAHPDANHITLYANGEFLLRDDGYCDKVAGNHNTLLVNGKGQLGEGGDWLLEWYYFDENAEPFVKLAESNSAYDYIVGNATEAYSKDLKLDLFERNVLWLKDEKVLLVVDNIKTGAIVDLELRWFPQSKNVGPSGDVYIIQGNNNTMNFYPMTDETTTEFVAVETLTRDAKTTEKTFRQTYKGTDWQNAVAFAWNDKGEEVAYVTYMEGENANEHQFGVNGKIYTINVASNKITVTEGELEIEGDTSDGDSTISTVIMNGQIMEDFDPAVKEYTVDRWWKTANVTVDAYTGAYGASYEIEYGENVITLTCTSRDGTSKTTYTFNITNTQNILGIAGAETDRPRDGFDLGWTYDNVITPTNTGNIWANTGLPTITYDLGKVVNLQDVIIAFNLSALRDAYYDLLYSIDGENWIYLQEDATAKQTSGAMNGWHDPVKVVDNANVNARYIKIKLRAHSQSGKDDAAAYCSIQEITFTGALAMTYADLMADLSDDNNAVLFAPVDGAGKDLVLKKGQTIDLAGNNLTIGCLSALKGAKVIDSVGGGKLIVEKSNLLLQKDNGYLPIEVDGGYVFSKVKLTNHMLVDDNKDNTLGYAVRPSLGVANNAAYLMDGAADNGLSIILRLSWTNSNGTTTTMDVPCSEEKIKEVYAQGSKLAFVLTAAGADKVSNLKVATVVCSNTGVVVESEALDYTGSAAK
ncbi:MAG: hypothetical protein E7433_04645 [Ruminococcaceae bacterium]|nr:hypothetical protein [Oscillospiraceae bacterium]